DNEQVFGNAQRRGALPSSFFHAATETDCPPLWQVKCPAVDYRDRPAQRAGKNKGSKREPPTAGAACGGRFKAAGCLLEVGGRLLQGVQPHAAGVQRLLGRGDL